MNLKNSLGPILLLLILFAGLAGFSAFRIANQMTTTPVPGENRLGPLEEAGLLDGGIRYHRCNGTLFLRTENDVDFSPELSGLKIHLLDEQQKIIGNALIPTNQKDMFTLRIPEGHSGLASIETEETYRILTLLEHNLFYTLYPAATFEGTVLGHAFVLQGEKLPDPEPLAQTKLIIETPNGWRRQIETDGRGKFSVSIPPGPFSVLLRSDSHSDAYFDDLSVKTGETIERQLILPAGCELEGFVLGDKVTLDGAKVSLITSMEDEAEAISGERGMFKIRGLTQGMATVYIQHPGYQEEAFEMLVPGDKIGLRKPFLLKRSADFTGSVTLNSSSSIPDARVRVVRAGQLIYDGTITELNALDILASGQTYSFCARWNPTPEAPENILYSNFTSWTMPATGPGQLQLELAASASIKGMVNSKNSGVPYGGVSVKIEPVGNNFANLISKTEVWCDPQGRFQSPPLPLGTYALTAQHPRYGVTQSIVRLTEPGAATPPLIILPE